MDSPDAAASEGDGSAVVHECRNCGTNVSPKTTRCPVCDSDEIVTYPVD
ncbi:hypothetical protein ACFQGT_11545 [Natrialbaceae archaeon GCM10025810]